MIPVLIAVLILFLLFFYSLTFRATLKYVRVRHSKDKVKRSYAFVNCYECLILSIGMTAFVVGFIYLTL